jgi:hypothetical protein
LAADDRAAGTGAGDRLALNVHYRPGVAEFVPARRASVSTAATIVQRVAGAAAVLVVVGVLLAPRTPHDGYDPSAVAVGVATVVAGWILATFVPPLPPLPDRLWDGVAAAACLAGTGFTLALGHPGGRPVAGTAALLGAAVAVHVTARALRGPASGVLGVLAVLALLGTSPWPVAPGSGLGVVWLPVTVVAVVAVVLRRWRGRRLPALLLAAGGAAVALVATVPVAPPAGPAGAWTHRAAAGGVLRTWGDGVFGAPAAETHVLAAQVVWLAVLLALGSGLLLSRYRPELLLATLTVAGVAAVLHVLHGGSRHLIPHVPVVVALAAAVLPGLRTAAGEPAAPAWAEAAAAPEPVSR